jgi:pimeloyl-ACP methyl ester carboxylesterase
VTLATTAPRSAWDEPAGATPRGTLVVVPGRGEQPAVYERFGRRLAADAYRVRVVPDPTLDEGRTLDLLRAALDGPGPHVLVGSDAGALYAAGLVATGAVSVSALVLAGLPVAPPGPYGDEIAARTACPVHRARLADGAVLRPGAVAEPPPAGWLDRAVPADVGVPVLGLHGADDVISPLEDSRHWYADVPGAELVAIAGGVHDALNDQTHRTAAATIVLFLERLRAAADAVALPVIARPEVLR